MRKYKSIYKESEIYKNILNQLGNNKFIAMTGAKNFVYSDKEKSVSFKIGSGAKKGILYIVITLKGNDLYDIEFMNRKPNTVSKYENVYGDKLKELFTKETGFDTSL